MTTTEIQATPRVHTFRWQTYEVVSGRAFVEGDGPDVTVLCDDASVVHTSLKRCYPDRASAVAVALDLATRKREESLADYRKMSAAVLHLEAASRPGKDPEAVDLGAPTPVSGEQTVPGLAHGQTPQRGPKVNGVVMPLAGPVVTDDDDEEDGGEEIWGPAGDVDDEFRPDHGDQANRRRPIQEPAGSANASPAFHGQQGGEHV